VDYIEGGWPGANPTDSEFFAHPPQTQARFTAFGMTKRAGRSVENDDVLSAVVNAGTESVCLVGKTHDFHVEKALGISLEENLTAISQSIAHLVAVGREAVFDAEHFFDGYKSNPDYATKCAKAAYEAGARWIVLCDTNGGAMPYEVERIVGEVIAAGVPGDHVGIHTHNDTENAVSNSLAAILAGARQVQGTLNGLGERCGNANLISLIPTLVLKEPFASQFETCVDAKALESLTRVSRAIDDILNRVPTRQAAYVGASAFVHKSGLHASAILKDPSTYEHIDPSIVGNERHYLISDQTGRSNILARFKEVGIEIAADDPRIETLIRQVKELEFNGWAFDSAEASFELLARRLLGEVSDYFDVGRFRVMDERRFNAKGDLVVESEATATITVQGESHHEVAVGNGPVNAVDKAVRRALVQAYPQLAHVELIDYKVRILEPHTGQSGTGAFTRVLIEFQDETGLKWTTVGVSTNVIDASIIALTDGMSWKLMKLQA